MEKLGTEAATTFVGASITGLRTTLEKLIGTEATVEGASISEIGGAILDSSTI